jgi:hypothetical protein
VRRSSVRRDHRGRPAAACLTLAAGRLATSGQAAVQVAGHDHHHQLLTPVLSAAGAAGAGFLMIAMQTRSPTSVRISRPGRPSTPRLREPGHLPTTNGRTTLTTLRDMHLTGSQHSTRRISEYELRTAPSNAPSSARISASTGWLWAAGLSGLGSARTIALNASCTPGRSSAGCWVVSPSVPTPTVRRSRCAGWLRTRVAPGWRAGEPRTSPAGKGRGLRHAVPLI